MGGGACRPSRGESSIAAAIRGGVAEHAGPLDTDDDDVLEDNWAISGGTGGYAGVQGTGTWIADGGTFPYFIHTEYGSIHFTGTSG